VQDVEPFLPRAVIEGREKRLERIRAHVLAQTRQRLAKRPRPRQIGDQLLTRAQRTFYGITGFAEICPCHG